MTYYATCLTFLLYDLLNNYSKDYYSSYILTINELFFDS